MIPVLAKAGIVVVIAGISCAGVALMTKDYEPKWNALSKDKHFDKDGYSSRKFGGMHKNYVVGVKQNQNWWNWSYARLLEDKESSHHFKAHGDLKDIKVRMGFSTRERDIDALNQVCDRIYKENSTNVKHNPSRSEYSIRDVWKYCTSFGEQPKTIKDASHKYPEGSIGKKQEGKLVDVEGNDLFWKIRNKEFYVEDEMHLRHPVDKVDPFFYNKWLQEKDDIRKICALAYNMKGDGSDGGPTEEETVKFCSVEGKQKIL